MLRKTYLNGALIESLSIPDPDCDLGVDRAIPATVPGNVTATTGVGNADDIFAGDNIHPVQRGMEIIADRESQAIEGILAALSL